MPPLTTEEVTDFKEAYGLLGAEELRAQLGDSEEQDALINAILGEGKAVETPGVKADETDDDDAVDPPAAVVKAEATTDDDDDDHDEVDPPAAVVEAAAAPEVVAVVDTSADVAALDLTPLDTQYADKLKALDVEKKAKFAEVMDGTMTADAYSEYEANYMNTRDALREQKASDREWFTEVHNFKLEAARTSGINYDTDTEKSAAWDDWVKRLGSKPENAGKDGKWYLEQAHKKVMAEYDITPQAAATVDKPAKAAAPANKVVEKKGRAPNLSNIPPTLGGLPAAAKADTGGDSEFGHIDRLTGMDLENAIARMSADQRARYEVA